MACMVLRYFAVRAASTARRSPRHTSRQSMTARSQAWRLRTEKSVRPQTKAQPMILPHTHIECSVLDHGSCHCGAVRLAVKMKPLETWDTLSDGEYRVVECNCSICVRVSAAWMFIQLINRRLTPKGGRIRMVLPTQGPECSPGSREYFVSQFQRHGRAQSLLQALWRALVQ